MRIQDFSIELNKNEILNSIGCNNIIQFEYLKNFLYTNIKPYAIIKFGYFNNKKVIYVIMTVGNKIMDLIYKIFDDGNYLNALLLDTMTNNYLFQMDFSICKQLKLISKKYNFGIKARLEPSNDIPIETQKLILEQTKAEIEINESFIYNPIKTIGYILEITNNKNEFNAIHNCNMCKLTDCKFKIERK